MGGQTAQVDPICAPKCMRFQRAELLHRGRGRGGKCKALVRERAKTEARRALGLCHVLRGVVGEETRLEEIVCTRL